MDASLMSVKELKAAIESRGKSKMTRGFTEKHEFVTLLTSLLANPSLGKEAMEKRGVTLLLLKRVAAAALARHSDEKYWNMGMLSYALIGNHETIKQDDPKSRWNSTPVDPGATLTHAARSSLINMLETSHKVVPHPVLNVVYEEAVGQANIFLSFAYLDNFIEMVDAIECFMQSSGMAMESTFFWFDVCVNDQWVALD